ncbi:calcyphosin-like protein [Argonauta hians]
MAQEMSENAKKELAGNKTPIEKLRSQCMARGVSGIIKLGKMFKIFDDDGNNKIDFREFTKGIHDYGVVMDEDELKNLFQDFDSDGNQMIDFEEFLKQLRPPMNKSRIDVVMQAFSKLDKTNDGIITVEDLKGVYNARKHPKYLSGEYTEKQCLQLFLEPFDTDIKDGQVTKEEFLNYYSGVSNSINDDDYFDMIIRSSWDL